MIGPAGRPGQPGSVKKCHEFETDLGDIAVRQPRIRRSNKINMPREVRPYTLVGSHAVWRNLTTNGGKVADPSFP